MSPGSGVPERGIPLVCWSYALVPETYLGQRPMTHFVQKGASCKFKRDHLPRKGASTRLVRLMADQVKSPLDKELWLQLAADWMAMASMHERFS